MEKVIFVLCEGPHDVAFLYRLFAASGFELYKEKIGKLPSPIYHYILRALKESAYENMQLSLIREKPIPSDILFRENTLVVFYVMGGDSKSNKRKELLKDVSAFTAPDPDALDTGNGLEYSIVYFMDADHKGIAKRVKEIEKELQEINENTSLSLSHSGKPIRVKGVKVGCYIFASANEQGKLEDIMVPLMEQENEEIFTRAAEYLNLKEDARLKKLKIKLNHQRIPEESRSSDKMSFDFNKSKISIAGQLQNSGKSNAVIIRDCDYINLAKIKANPHCQQILAFIENILSEP